MEEVTRGWRKLHNDELHDLYSWVNIIRAGNEASMGQVRGANKVWIAKTKGKRCLENLGIDGSILLNFILKEIGWDAVSD